MSNSDSPHIFTSFLGKNRIFATFRFNTQYAFPESGKHFFASKMSNLDLKNKFIAIILSLCLLSNALRGALYRSGRAERSRRDYGTRVPLRFLQGQQVNLDLPHQQ